MKFSSISSFTREGWAVGWGGVICEIWEGFEGTGAAGAGANFFFPINYNRFEVF